MAQITKDLAERIARKLGAEVVVGRQHDLCRVFVGGALIAQFGLRRGARSLGHDFIAGQIHLSMSKAKRLGQCTMSREEWISDLRERGIIEG